MPEKSQRAWEQTQIVGYQTPPAIRWLTHRSRKAGLPCVSGDGAVSICAALCPRVGARTPSPGPLAFGAHQTDARKNRSDDEGDALVLLRGPAQRDNLRWCEGRTWSSW